MTFKSIRPEKASPVTALEFYNALIQLWRGSRRYPRRDPRPDKLGLAVSGGGDSMALAYLCKQLASEKLIPGLSVQAFVVDHQARKESTKEANKVSGWLKDLGLQSKLLTLQWPRGSIPSQLSDFETQARRLRYQVLGRACRDNNIPALLLGHHLDDNIETVIMRLSQGQQGMGLKGVPNIGLLPECHGIYSVSGSGGIMDLADIRSRSIQSDVYEKPDSGSNISHPIVPAGDEQLPISDGGISILRPFDSFPKARLLATCTDNGVPFVNDPTNFDFALTPRNTVRYLLSSDRLPKAFQPASILKMIEEGKAMDKDLTAVSNSILRKSRIIDFDRRSGKLLIQFPHSTEASISDTETRGNLTNGSGEKEKFSALSIRRVLDLVSPGEDNAVRLEDCQQLSRRIFSKHNGTQRTKDGRVDPNHPAGMIAAANKFTLGGVQFQRAELNEKYSQSNTWLLNRESFRSMQAKPITTISLPPQERSLDNSSSSNILPWSNWHLWDNRYWIRIQTNNHDQENKAQTITPNPNNITIRPLEESDLTFIRHQPTLLKRVTQKHNNQTKEKHNHYIPIKPKEFNRLLSDCAPGRVRFTLPVIAETTGEKRVLALPTLGIALPSLETANTRTDSDEDYLYFPPRIKWEILYKRVDPEVLELTQAVV